MTTVSFVTVFVIRPAPAGAWEFLQILRSPNRYMENTWQLVSGGIEPDEPAWQAALRELQEETALRPTEFYTLDHLSIFYIPEQDARCESINFCAVVSPDAPVTLNHEHTAHRWIPAHEIESALMWPGQRLGAREVLSEIIANGPSKPHARINLA